MQCTSTSSSELKNLHYFLTSHPQKNTILKFIFFPKMRLKPQISVIISSTFIQSLTPFSHWMLASKTLSHSYTYYLKRLGHWNACDQLYHHPRKPCVTNSLSKCVGTRPVLTWEALKFIGHVRGTKFKVNKPHLKKWIFLVRDKGVKKIIFEAGLN